MGQVSWPHFSSRVIWESKTSTLSCFLLHEETNNMKVNEIRRVREDLQSDRTEVGISNPRFNIGGLQIRRNQTISFIILNAQSILPYRQAAYQ